MFPKMIRDRIVGLKHVVVKQLRGFSGGNPKTYNASDRDLLERSIENHGYVLPVAVRDLGDGTYELIDGHHRVQVIEGLDSSQRIKVLVLDVESVAEGRRILLALQHTAGFDHAKLEEFVRAALAEGTHVDDLMADTGLTSSHLDAFATAGSNMLDSMSAEQSTPADVDSSGAAPDGRDPVMLPDRRVSLMFSSEQWDQLKDALNGKPTPEEVLRLVKLGKRTGTKPTDESKSTLENIASRAKTKKSK